MTGFDFIVLSLATWQAIEIYHHSYLFAEVRLSWQQPVTGSFLGFVQDLQSCPWCLSVWVAAILATWFAVCSQLWSPLTWPIYWLAISRAANLANDFFYLVTRTPKP